MKSEHSKLDTFNVGPIILKTMWLASN